MTHAGRTLVTCDVVITDDQDRRVCTARVTSMLRDRPAGAPDRIVLGEEAQAVRTRVASIVESLAAHGANEIPHPGGTLLAHLKRVHALLTAWGARPAVRLAGAVPCLLRHRRLPHRAGRPGLPRRAGRDHRRGGRTARPLLCRLRPPFLLPSSHRARGTVQGSLHRHHAPSATAAAAGLRGTHRGQRARRRTGQPRPARRARAGLLGMFTSWRELLSDPAWQAVQTTLR